MSSDAITTILVGQLPGVVMCPCCLQQAICCGSSHSKQLEALTGQMKMLMQREPLRPPQSATPSWPNQWDGSPS